MNEEMINNTLQSSTKLLFSKQDIMEVFGCQSDKALRILKVMHAMKYATRIGREYYTTCEDLMEFYRDKLGKKVLV